MLALVKHLPSILLCLASLGIGAAQSVPNPTAALLQELIRVDTSNPPGATEPLDALLAAKLRPLGFEVTIIPTPVPHRTHLIARLRGDGSLPPVLLAAHGDVVGVEREKWTLDPFAGILRDGYIYGRGALDFKGGLAVFARAVMQLAEQRVPLKRDVILLVEADEESGGPYGTEWLAEKHWDLMRCAFALNEGGWIMEKQAGSATPATDAGVRYVSISTADKQSLSLLLTAHGTSTHSSLPRPDNAIFSLARALTRVAAYETPVRMTAGTRAFFGALAATSTPPDSHWLRTLSTSHDPIALSAASRHVSRDPLLHALLHNTIAPVFLQAGFRGNVIPGSATATLNFRVIPGTTADELSAEMRRVVHDPTVTIAPVPVGAEPVDPKFTARMARLAPSSLDTPLYQALAGAARAQYPGAAVTPYLFQAGTDAAAWRSRGVPVYGIYPYPITAADLSRMHGNDERISVASLASGTAMIYRTLRMVEGASK